MSPNIENNNSSKSIEKPASGLPEQNFNDENPYQIDNKNLEMIAKLMELKSNSQFVEFVQGRLGKGQKFGSLTNEQLVQFAKGYEKMALYKNDPGFIEYVKGRDVNKLNWKEIEIYADGYEKRKIHEAKLKSQNKVGGQGAGGFDSVVVGSGEGNGANKKNDIKKTTDKVVVGGEKSNENTSHEVGHNVESNNGNGKDTQKQEKTEVKPGYAKTSIERLKKLEETVKLTEEESKLLSSWDSKKVNDLQYEMEYFAKSGKHKEEEREAYKQHLIKKYGVENKNDQPKKEENKENKTEQKTEQTAKLQEGQTTNQTVENVLEKTIQNPDGSKTKQEFGPDGKLTAEIVMFPDESQTGKKYDAAGKVIGEYRMEKNGDLKTIEIKKDDQGQEMKVETFQSADKKNTSVTETRADGSKTETKSDTNGKEITVWDKNDKVIEHMMEKNNDTTKPTDQTVVENKPEVSQMEKILNWSNDLQKSGMSQDDIQKLLNSDESKKFLQDKENQIDWSSKDNLEKYAEWRQDILKDLPDNLNKIQKFQTLNKLNSIVSGKNADMVEQMYNDYFLQENMSEPGKSSMKDKILSTVFKKGWDVLENNLPAKQYYGSKVEDLLFDRLRNKELSWDEKLYLLNQANRVGDLMDDFKTKGLPVEYMEEWLGDDKNNAKILKLIKEPKKNSGDMTK